MSEIYVTYCSRSKSEKEYGRPAELYDNQRIRSFFANAPEPRAILSYKHGLIPENKIIDNYDLAYFIDIEYCAL